MSEARAHNRTRGKASTRKRQTAFARLVLDGRRIAREDAREVAARYLRENPNAGKRHAARMAPARENSGARAKSDPRVELRTGRELLSGYRLHIVTTKNLPTDATR